jgi:hypothetical protein
MADGIYTITFRGATGWGMGLLLLQYGTVTGADSAGALYDGRFQDETDSLVLDVKMTVPPGVALVQGSIPRATPYEVPFRASISKRAIEFSEPTLIDLPPGPVNVIVKCLRRL